MTVILKMDDGDQIMLDRRLSTFEVANTVNEARGKGKLIEFQNNDTPSRAIFVDPDHVVVIKNDGYNY